MSATIIKLSFQSKLCFQVSIKYNYEHRFELDSSKVKYNNEHRFELDGSKVDTEAEKDTKTTVTSDIFTETQTQSLEAWIKQSKHSLTSAISTLLNLKSR